MYTTTTTTNTHNHITMQSTMASDTKSRQQKNEIQHIAKSDMQRTPTCFEQKGKPNILMERTKKRLNDRHHVAKTLTRTPEFLPTVHEELSPRKKILSRAVTSRWTLPM